MVKRLLVPAVLLAGVAGCAGHHHRRYEERVVVRDAPVVEERDVVVYEVEGAPPPTRVEIRPIAPYREAVWYSGHWERDREHRRWVWRHGYWR